LEKKIGEIYFQREKREKEKRTLQLRRGEKKKRGGTADSASDLEPPLHGKKRKDARTDQGEKKCECINKKDRKGNTSFKKRKKRERKVDTSLGESVIYERKHTEKGQYFQLKKKGKRQGCTLAENERGGRNHHYTAEEKGGGERRGVKKMAN